MSYDQEAIMLPDADACFHCGEKLPKAKFETVVLGESRVMCCLGCQLVAQSIVEAGLEQYYLDRRTISPTASLPDALNFEVYNHEDIKAQFTYEESGATVTELSVIGLRCAACTWLIERKLHQLDGVGFCQVNLTQQRMRVAWDETVVSIAQILQAVHSVGYDAKPYRADSHNEMMRRHNKAMLIRLLIAGFGAMQAMMFSVGLYFGEYSGIADEHRDFLRMVSMIVSVPVVGYAGLPFFASAWSAIKARQINMDVPVSVALLLTFFASSYATLTKTGETYFDSVAMFVFFLLAGRYVEHSARTKAANMASDLVLVAPKLVKKLGADPHFVQRLLAQESAGEASDDRQANRRHDKQALIKDWLSEHPIEFTSTVLPMVHKVAVGDVVHVDAGDEIIGDGILITPVANVSMSLVTGESDLVVKVQGDTLVGGSQNDSIPLVMIVTKTVEASQIALIDRLINRAMSEKPKIAQDADKMARWFVARVLVLAVLVFLVWSFIDVSQALWATVAVLVATCPCALSLATPIALTVATNRLSALGFLTTRGHTIQTLSQIDHVAFDKTGTLTAGRAELIAYGDQAHTEQLPYSALAIAAALEMGSRHPVATSLIQAAKNEHLPVMSDIVHHAAGGVSGVFDGDEYRIGHPSFVLGDQADRLPKLPSDATMQAVLGRRALDDASATWQVLQVFYFNDRLRSDAKAVSDALAKRGIKVLMLTGDPSPNAHKLAQILGISAHTGLLPEQKVAHIKHLQAQGHSVLMVGDGINDAPVLAAANVSTAMASASDLAQVSSDSVLLNDALSPIVRAITISTKTQQIIRQNLRWALAYNSVVLLPAALGYVPPWLAAIGMSLSSLFVVVNAMRIARG